MASAKSILIVCLFVLFSVSAIHAQDKGEKKLMNELYPNGKVMMEGYTLFITSIDTITLYDEYGHEIKDTVVSSDQELQVGEWVKYSEWGDTMSIWHYDMGELIKVDQVGAPASDW